MKESKAPLPESTPQSRMLAGKNPCRCTIQMDIPGSCYNIPGLASLKFVFEFDFRVDKADSQWQFGIDPGNGSMDSQWVIDRNGEIKLRGSSTGFTVAANTTYRFSWVIDRANDAQVLYVDGAQIATGDLHNDPTGVRALKMQNTLAAPYGDTDISLYLDNICAYEYSLAQIQSNVPATPEPTEAVTEAPATAAPAEATLIRTFNLNEGYYNNSNGGTYGYQDGVLTMAANVNGAGAFSRIYWMNSAEKAADPLTWAFDAKVFGWEGYANEYDGFVFRLRYNDAGNNNGGIGTANLFRVYPLASDVKIRVNGGAEETVAGGFHAYSCVCNVENRTYTLYVDGTALFSDVALPLAEGKELNGFYIENGMNRKCNCKLRLANMQTYSGSYVRSAPGSYTEPVAPVMTVSDAQGAANGENAFYYVINLTLNDGVASALNVKYYPEGYEESARVQDFNISNISGVTAKLISVLKDIPAAQADRLITTKATFSYAYDCDNTSAVVEKSTTLNGTKQ